MDKIKRSKWQVRAAAFIIFVLGFAAGSLAFNGYQKWRSREQYNRHDRFERMLDRLQLNNEQRTQVQQILGDTRAQLQALRQESEPQVDAIRQQADERLQKVMTPEQWQQFQQMRSEMHRRGWRGRGRGE